MKLQLYIVQGSPFNFRQSDISKTVSFSKKKSLNKSCWALQGRCNDEFFEGFSRLTLFLNRNIDFLFQNLVPWKKANKFRLQSFLYDCNLSR